MTPMQFIAEAKRRGKDKEETRKKYNELLSAGFFEEEEREKPITGSSGDIPRAGIVRGLTEDQQAKEPEYIKEFGEKPIVKKGKAFAAGFGTGATLGLSQLIPPLKKEAEKARREEPLAYGAGEIASFATPGLGQAKAFKGAGKIASRVLPKAPKIVKGMAQAGMAGAVVEGTRGATEEGGIDVEKGLTRAAVAAPIEAITAGTMDILGAGLKKAASKMYAKALPYTRKAVKKGFDSENIIKYDLEGITVEETIKKAEKTVNSADTKLTQMVDGFIKKNPNKKVDIDDIFIKTIEDVDNGNINTILVDEEEAVIKYIDNVFNRLAKKGKTGEINAKQLRELKSDIGKRAFQKTRELTSEDAVKVKGAKELYISLLEKFTEMIPESKAQNKIMADLIPVIGTVEQAAEKFSGEKFLSMNDYILLSGGGLGVMGGPAVSGGFIAALAAKKGLQHGRGAALTSLTGKGLQTEAAKRTAIGIAGKQSPRLRFGKEEDEELTQFKRGRR